MESADKRSARNVVLVGMRATGKTTLGLELAGRLQRPFLDLDDEVGRLAGCDADALLAEQGEAAFRAWERRALLAAAERSGHVIATGGGAVLHATEFGALARTAVVVWLQASPQVLLSRAAARPRPPLTGLTPAQEIAALLAQREPLYRAAAQIAIPVGDGDPILALLQALQAHDARNEC